ncbi:MAG: MurR/RpiR family transcriptional regulator [Pseudomonadota bacterium]
MTEQKKPLRSVKAAINSALDNLSFNERKIAEFTLKNYRDCAVMGIEELGRASDTSAPTVSRYTHKLGFDGYQHYLASLRDDISTLSSLKALEENLQADCPEEALRLSLLTDADQLQRLIDGMDPLAFSDAMEAIMSATRIFVIGQGSSRYVAGYLVFNLQGLGLDVVDLAAESGIEGIGRKLLKMDDTCVLIAIAFPRFSDLTIEVASICKMRGCEVLSISDRLGGALGQASDHLLCAPSRKGLHSGSGVSAMAVVEAILTSATALAEGAEIAAKHLAPIIDPHLRS